MENSKSCLVVLSGGQDSSTCLFWAKKHFESVYALGFIYGQRHAGEIEAAKIIAEKAGVEFQVMDLSFISKLSSNALTDESLEMDKDKTENAPPNTFVPGRNLFFISTAAVYAMDKGIKDLILGVSQTDYSGYPDCRDSFIKSANVTLNLALDDNFRIHTPLMYLDKSEVWKLSDELGVLELIKNETVTCYKGIKAQGCGECPSCKLRNAGLIKYLNTKK